MSQEKAKALVLCYPYQPARQLEEEIGKLQLETENYSSIEAFYRAKGISTEEISYTEINLKKLAEVLREYPVIVCDQVFENDYGKMDDGLIGGLEFFRHARKALAFWEKEEGKPVLVFVSPFEKVIEKYQKELWEKFDIFSCLRSEPDQVAKHIQLVREGKKLSCQELLAKIFVPEGRLHSKEAA